MINQSLLGFIVTDDLVWMPVLPAPEGAGTQTAAIGSHAMTHWTILFDW